MIVTGYDDRHGCGYVLRTGPDANDGLPLGDEVGLDGVAVRATPELAARLRCALRSRATASLGWQGPRVPLTLDDATLLAWLRYDVGGVLSVRGGPRKQG
ncbi:MAG TPA: hypothetical protein VKZ81_14240 [Pseudonocardia sp.]|mgnify:CR=1 FL=1|jgi:hypothetical protein|uniref:hypothetical protein n=1 Tax=Pseudonocardia sp. TaxID=60912 RepID=UPI002B4B0909|nr:hypothetical protein [Pseudonocardia sp.]HLU56614.1 hypothetical protein [Pseudonocardia sp.]